MKLTVFGPTGATGEQILRRALAAGHDVTAVARRPEVPSTFVVCAEDRAIPANAHTP